MRRNEYPTLGKNNYLNVMIFINEFGRVMGNGNGAKWELLDFQIAEEKDKEVKTYLFFTMRYNDRPFTTSATGEEEFYLVEDWKVDITGDEIRRFEFELSQVTSSRYETMKGDNLNMYT